MPHGKELVPLFIRKADDLVLDAGAIARPHALDLSPVERGTVDIFQDDALCLLVRPGDVAHRLVLARVQGVIGEGHDGFVALLHLQIREIDAGPQHARGRPRLEAAQAQAQLFQGVAQKGGREHAVRPALIGHVAHKNFAAEEGAGRDDHRLYGILRAHAGGQDPVAALLVQVDDLRLLELQIRLQFQLVLHHLAVFAAVDLRAQGMHGRALALIQHAALQKGRVRRAPHLAAERVDLAHQMALRRAADRRVARAVSHRIHIDSEYHRLTAEARRGQRRLNARMSRADHRDVICSGLIGQIGFPLYRFPKIPGASGSRSAKMHPLCFSAIVFQRPSFQKQPLSPANATESPLFLHSL